MWSQVLRKGPWSPCHGPWLRLCPFPSSHVSLAQFSLARCQPYSDVIDSRAARRAGAAAEQYTVVSEEVCDGDWALPEAARGSAVCGREREIENRESNGSECDSATCKRERRVVESWSENSRNKEYVHEDIPCGIGRRGKQRTTYKCNLFLSSARL